MEQSLLNVRMTENARLALSTLGPEDRRLVESWFDHLRNWSNDDFIRNRSKILKGLPGEVRVFQTSGDILVAFKIERPDVTILAIFRKDSLRRFHGANAEALGT